jgi:hypothetical protein
VIIFDWDDTLLSSSYLSGRGIRLDSDKSRLVEVEAGLKELEQTVCSVLSLALSFAHSVHIITNAETGWVQLSAQKFMPAVVPFLSKVNVLSARSTFENRYPDSPLKWKFFAFQQQLQPAFYKVRMNKNIISFGDSHVEREAVRAVTRGISNTKCKSVKFAERPTIEQLRRQIELVVNCFNYIHNHEGDLDLQLTVTINNNANGTTNQQQQITMPNQVMLPSSTSSSSSSSSDSYLSSCDREAIAEVAQQQNGNAIINEDKPITV